MFELNTCSLPGVVALRPIVRRDARGFFIKTIHRQYFAEHKLPSDFAEQYYSVSEQNVLRGLHFQTPPSDHYKLVTCVQGDVLDVVVDLRRGAPTYGQYEMFELSGEKADSVFIPAGFAHGFYVRSGPALLWYNVSTMYSPAHDTGIHWNSVGVPWPKDAPIVSDRDAAFQYLSDFETPF